MTPQRKEKEKKASNLGLEILQLKIRMQRDFFFYKQGNILLVVDYFDIGETRMLVDQQGGSVN